MEHDGEDRRLRLRCPLHRQIDGLRGFGFNPITETAQRAVGGECCADAGAKGVKSRAAVTSLN